jgi:hypothetical protein
LSFFECAKDAYFDTATWPEQLETWLSRRVLDACSHCPYAVMQAVPRQAEVGIPHKQYLIDKVFARMAG